MGKAAGTHRLISKVELTYQLNISMSILLHIPNYTSFLMQLQALFLVINLYLHDQYAILMK